MIERKQLTVEDILNVMQKLDSCIQPRIVAGIHTIEDVVRLRFNPMFRPMPGFEDSTVAYQEYGNNILVSKRVYGLIADQWDIIKNMIIQISF